MNDNGHIKFQLDWQRAPAIASDLIRELADWRQLLYDAGLIGWYHDAGIGFGNLSARLGSSNSFVISGNSTGNLRLLGPEHFAIVTAVDLAANRITCRGPIRASSESMTHAALYALDPAIGAVVHVHSATLWEALRDEVPTTAAEVAYGTPAMARELQRLYRESDLCERRIAVMGGHFEGLVTTGQSIAEATLRILEYRDRPQPTLAQYRSGSEP